MLSRAAGVTCVYVPGDAEDQLYQRCSHEAAPAMHVGAVQAVPGVCKGARDHVPAATGGKRKQVDFAHADTPIFITAKLTIVRNRKMMDCRQGEQSMR